MDGEVLTTGSAEKSLHFPVLAHFHYILVFTDERKKVDGGLVNITGRREIVIRMLAGTLEMGLLSGPIKKMLMQGRLVLVYWCGRVGKE